MTNDNYIPTIEQNRLAWFNNFVTVATANVTLLAFTPSDMTALNGTVGGYSTAVNIGVTTRTAFHAATKSKTAANKTVTATVRSLVRRVQSNPAVTPALKTQLQINPRTTPRTKTAPIAPTGLLATPDADGTNTLTWSGNGNKKATTYIIESHDRERDKLCLCGRYHRAAFRAPRADTRRHRRVPRHGLPRQDEKRSLADRRRVPALARRLPHPLQSGVGFFYPRIVTNYHELNTK